MLKVIYIYSNQLIPSFYINYVSVQYSYLTKQIVNKTWFIVTPKSRDSTDKESSFCL